MTALRSRFGQAALSLLSQLALVFSAQAVFPFGPGGQEWKLTIRDNLGRSVSIPARADRIFSLQPEITRIIVALGAGDRLVGVDYFIRRDDHLFKIVFPRGSQLPVVSQPDDSVNKELAVKLDPDIIFASPMEQQVPESNPAQPEDPRGSARFHGTF